MNGLVLIAFCLLQIGPSRPGIASDSVIIPLDSTVYFRTVDGRLYVYTGTSGISLAHPPRPFYSTGLIHRSGGGVDTVVMYNEFIRRGSKYLTISRPVRLIKDTKGVTQ